MIQGQSLNDLAAVVLMQAASVKDYAMDTKNLHMTDRAELSFNIGNDIRVVSPTELCLSQIGNRVGIPAKYLERMRMEAPALLAANVNHWFEHKNEVRMLRTFQNGVSTARAFLSHKYRPLDNVDLLQAVLPKLQSMGIVVISAKVTDSHLYIQATTSRLTGEIKKGQVVQYGIVISNSEVGCGSVKVEPMIYILACTNGMILPTALRKYHVGKTGGWDGDEAYEVFSDRTRQLSDKAFWAQVCDVVDASLDEIKFKAALEQMQIAAGMNIGDPVKAVEDITKKYTLTEHESHNVLTHLAAGMDLSLWGLSNAVTRTAQDGQTYDRAIELERVGGEVIELPKNFFN